MFISTEIPTAESFPGHSYEWTEFVDVPGKMFRCAQVKCSCGFLSQPAEGLTNVEVEATTHLVRSGVDLGETERLFATQTVGETFVIQLVGHTRLYKLNWMFFDGRMSDSAAWARARVQTLPARVLYGNGGSTDLGLVFDPRIFEQTAYQGYVSAGFAMSDGYYAPIRFDSWVASFRARPALPEPEQQSLLPALEAYKSHLAVAASTNA